MEGQESGSASSLAREGLLGASLTTGAHVSLRQSPQVLARAGNPPEQETASPASAATASSSSSSSRTLPTNFSSVNVEAAAALNCLSSYNEIVGKLNRLWDDQLAIIQHVDDSHWKNPEFPLARIKKIMRMDDDVKMISSEVPIMLSKVIEIFVTELSLRAWLHTEESKRRTVQRSDIAMAITKQDMFDFLIDIVPREEIQLKSKPQSKQTDSDPLQLLTPELLQIYMQHISQQQTTTATTARTRRRSTMTTQQQQLQRPTTSLGQLEQLASSQQQQQQQQQQLQLQQQQQQQTLAQQQLPTPQQLTEAMVGDMDEASTKIFQDNLALLQQLQQLVQLQMQVQQLQEANPVTATESVGGGLLLPTSEAYSHSSSTNIATSIATSLLNQPEQVMEASSTDNIHRVTINAANDMLTESELRSAITSLSSGDPPSPTAAPSLLAPLPPSSSSRLGRVAMAIEPELVEPGALANSPPPSHDDPVPSHSSAELLRGRRNKQIETQPTANSLALSTQTPLSVLTPSELSSSLSLPRGAGSAAVPISSTASDPLQERGRVSTSAQMRAFQQLQQLDPHISNILVQTGVEGAVGPDQFVIQTTPVLELVSSSHTVTINPSGVVSYGNPGGVVSGKGAGIQVSKGNQLSSTLTPIDAAQDSTYLSSLSTTTDTDPMDT